MEVEGTALFELTKEKGMEGITAKRKDSIYRPGKRTSDWLKIKARLQQEFVVGGFTAPKGAESISARWCLALTRKANSDTMAMRVRGLHSYAATAYLARFQTKSAVPVPVDALETVVR